ncbi:MAG: hypothetical protein ACYDBB_05005 [Armatimonadota bacterium]
MGTVYNFCTGHASLDGRTPAVAAGLVAERWTLVNLFTYRVPPPAWVPPKRRGRKPPQAPAAHASVGTTEG